MDIVFETSDSTAPLKQWLQAFKEIDESLLLEIDLAEDMFVTKTFTTDKTIVKYGKISFEQCNLSVLSMTDENGNSVSLSEWLTNHSGRVYVGLMRSLSKFINTIDLFSGEDVHKIIVRFSEVDGRYQANKVEFKSRSLNMVATCYNLSEFNLAMLDDNIFFDRVAAIPNAISFELNNNVNKSLIKASDINSNDPKKDIIAFSVVSEDDGISLHAKDLNNGYYDYRMSVNPIEGEENVSNAAMSPVTRANYIIGIKGDNAETSIITLSTVETQNGRLKIETSDKMFTTIIANVRV